jgi:hypothetical protein
MSGTTRRDFTRLAGVAAVFGLPGLSSAQEKEMAAEPAKDAAEATSPLGAVLFVRARSGLDPKELERRLLERRPRFLEVPGLLQKIYGQDPATGAVCGIYFFESQAALAAFRESELARSIPTAYETVEFRPEVYEVLYPLRPEGGPFPG